MESDSQQRFGSIDDVMRAYFPKEALDRIKLRVEHLVGYPNSSHLLKDATDPLVGSMEFDKKYPDSIARALIGSYRIEGFRVTEEPKDCDALKAHGSRWFVASKDGRSYRVLIVEDDMFASVSVSKSEKLDLDLGSKL
ncbi:hypothetical protein JW711_03375 [Candidatus Woesearchaeota archaeon]|nr:hypothetical protein [Candidatus Woesearchaeota archaeon]